MEIDTCYSSALPCHPLLPGQSSVTYLPTYHRMSVLQTESKTFKFANIWGLDKGYFLKGWEPLL